MEIKKKYLCKVNSVDFQGWKTIPVDCSFYYFCL